jgi:hypothetical protein
MKIKDIPKAETNGIRWLMASGVKNEDEALKLADKFIEKVEDMVR